MECGGRVVNGVGRHQHVHCVRRTTQPHHGDWSQPVCLCVYLGNVGRGSIDNAVVDARRPLPPVTMDSVGSEDVATVTTKMLQSAVSGGTLQYLNPDYMPPSVSAH